MQPVKIVVVGDGAVGKTCLCITYANGVFPPDYVPTVFDNYAASSTIDGRSYNVALWDTAGQEEYDRLRPLSYPNTHLFLACFSVASPSSLDNIKAKWVPEVRHHCPGAQIVLVGTKVDLRHDENTIQSLRDKHSKPVTAEQGKAVAKEINALEYVECSAKRNDGIHTVFETCLMAILTPKVAEKSSRTCRIL